MKLTKAILMQIISEELEKVLGEQHEVGGTADVRRPEAQQGGAGRHTAYVKKGDKSGALAGVESGKQGRSYVPTGTPAAPGKEYEYSSKENVPEHGTHKVAAKGTRDVGIESGKKKQSIPLDRETST